MVLTRLLSLNLSLELVPCTLEQTTTCFRKLAPVFHTSKFFLFLLFYLSILLISYSLLFTFLLTAPTMNDGYYGEQSQMTGKFFLFIPFFLSIY